MNRDRFWGWFQGAWLGAAIYHVTSLWITEGETRPVLLILIGMYIVFFFHDVFGRAT